jgi:hypothetical protein
MPYLAERFEAAVSALVSEGSVKDRLAAAYSDHLHAVTPVGGKEHCVRATIRKMSRIQAGDHARTILSLYTELAARGERSDPLKVVNGQSKAVNGKGKKAPRFVSQSA